MKNGIHKNISHEQYLKYGAVSNSYLKRLDIVPAAAKVEQEETDAMVVGRAFHSLTLEGEAAFRKSFEIEPEGLNKRTNAGKEAYAQILKKCAAQGKGLITSSQFDDIYAMSQAVHKHPLAKRMLAEGISEVTCIWEDQPTGLKLKCRPDRIPAGDKGIIIDLKSTADASEEAFLRQVVKLKYYMQAAHYLDGVNTAGEKQCDAFAFIAVEKKEPYRTEVYVLDEQFISIGREERDRLLRLESKCREENFWPHYAATHGLDLFPPRWME